MNKTQISKLCASCVPYAIVLTMVYFDKISFWTFLAILLLVWAHAIEKHWEEK